MFCPTNTKAPQVMVVSPVCGELAPVGADKAAALLPLRNLPHPDSDAQPAASHSRMGHCGVHVHVLEPLCFFPSPPSLPL